MYAIPLVLWGWDTVQSNQLMSQLLSRSILQNVQKAHFASGVQSREAGIAPGADDHMGPKLPEDLPAGFGCLAHTVHGVKVLPESFQILFSAQAGPGKGPQLIARLGHQLFFHVALGTDKQDLAVRMPPPHFPRNGNGGVDVSGGSAAGKDQIQTNILLNARLLYSRTRMINADISAFPVPQTFFGTAARVLFSAPVSGYIQHDSHFPQIHCQRRAAVGKEGQRDAGGGKQVRDNTQIKDRLHRDQDAVLLQDLSEDLKNALARGTINEIKEEAEQV